MTTCTGSMSVRPYQKARSITSSPSGDGTLLLEDASESQIWFTKSSTGTLFVSILGGNAGVNISSWAAGQDHVIDDFKAGATGKVLNASKVDALVQAMSGLTPPVPGQSTLPPATQAQLNSLIAASWA